MGARKADGRMHPCSIEVEIVTIHTGWCERRPTEGGRAETHRLTVARLHFNVSGATEEARRSVYGCSPTYFMLILDKIDDVCYNGLITLM